MRKANTWAREDWASTLRAVLIGTKYLGKTVQYISTIEVNEAFVKKRYSTLSDTSIQVDLPIPHGPVSASSKVNAINLIIAGTFDRDLAESTLSSADNILHQLMQG
jgi:hypothetical protein